MGSFAVAALRRRWYILAIGLLLTAGLSAAAWLLVPPSYEAQGSMLVLPSKKQAAAQGRNPFLDLNNLDAPASFVVSRLDGDQERLRVASEMPDSDYVIELDTLSRGPIIMVTATDKTPVGALQTLDLVLDAVPTALSDLQTEVAVPRSARLDVMRLVVDTQVTKLTRATIRAVVAATGLGLVITVLTAIAIESHSRRRSAGTSQAATQTRRSSDPKRHRPRSVAMTQKIAMSSPTRRRRQPHRPQDLSDRASSEPMDERSEETEIVVDQPVVLSRAPQ